MADHDDFDRSLSERLLAHEARVPGGTAPDLASIGSDPVRKRPGWGWGALVAAGGMAAGLLLVFFLGGRLQPPTGQATPQPTSSAIGSVAPSASVAPSPPNLSSLPGLIAFSRGGDLYTMRPDGTDVTQLTDDPAWLEYPVAWLTDGSRLAYLRQPKADTNPRVNPDHVDSTLILVHPDGSGAVELGVVRPWNSFSPDGTKIAFDGNGRPDGDGIAVFDLVHGTLTRLTHDGGMAALWSPDGSHIAYLFSGLSLEGLSLEIGTVTLDGHALAIAPDPGQDSPIRWVEVDGTLKLVFDSFRGFDPSVFDHRPWVVNADGTDLQLLAESGLSPRLEENPLPTVLSPDGRWVLSICDGQVVCVTPTDGSHEPWAIESGIRWELGKSSPTFSPDSRFIVYAFAVGLDQPTYVKVLLLPDGEPIAITAPASDTTPVWQPVQD